MACLVRLRMRGAPTAVRSTLLLRIPCRMRSGSACQQDWRRPQSSSADAYRRQLDGLLRMRDLVSGVDLSLPQIVVVGDQSSGKSSLLTEITGVTFPVSDGICTRAPIVVQCTRNADQEQSRIRIGDQTQGEIDAERVAEDIARAQEEALQHDGGREKISTKEIIVYAEGASLHDVTLVDLPGIINAGEGQEETRSLIQSYIRKEQTLILVVSEAKQDDELVTALDLAREADPEGRRTMRVLTKFDTFDSERAKARASELVSSEMTSPVRANSVMDLSPHAVVCRANGENYDERAETKELRNLPSAQAGVTSLKNRLPSIFRTLISTNLPVLQGAIEDEMRKAEVCLKQIGPERMSKIDMVRSVKEAFLVLDRHFEEGLSEHMMKFQQAVFASKRMVTKEWADTKYRPNAFQNPLFQGESAADACAKDMCAWWAEPLTDLLSSINEHAGPHAAEALHDHSLPQPYVDAVTRAWREEWARLFKKASDECHDDLRRASSFGTMNHYLTAKFQADRIMPEEILEKLLLPWSTEKQMKDGANVSSKAVRQTIKDTFRQLKAGLEKEYEKKGVHDQQKERVLRAVDAGWAVEHKSFIDNVMKTIRDNVVSGRAHWVNHGLSANEDIQRCAVESPVVQEKRRNCKDTISKLSEALKELERINS